VNVGVYLPTFAQPIVGSADRSVVENAQRAERLGFSTLWTIDHMLPTEKVHASSWYDPLSALVHAAAATERIELGTATLVVGFRHPFALAKQLATLAALAGPRVTLGASSGWFEGEYRLFGVEMKDRRGRTDECLSVLRELLSQSRTSFAGSYWSFSDVALVPRPEWHLPFLVGGGSRLPEAGAEVDMPRMTDSVLQRIARHDGWLAPCSGDDSLTASDLAAVRAAVRARPQGEDGFRYVQVQWTYVVETDDREKALPIQVERFSGVAGEGRSPAHLASCYLLGSIDDIRTRIRSIRDAGFDDIAISPAVNEPEQLELIADVCLEAARPDPLPSLYQR